MYLASHLQTVSNCQLKRREMLRVSAILHEYAGHGPFSHVSESVLERSHEESNFKTYIRISELSDILSEKFDPKETIKLISGEGRLGHIISGDS